MNFAPYRARFAEWLEGGHAELREVYPASEGFVAVADRAPGEGLRMILDHGLFYEFVPVSELDAPRPARHWIATAETGTDYALVLSTCAGCGPMSWATWSASWTAFLRACWSRAGPPISSPLTASTSPARRSSARWSRRPERRDGMWRSSRQAPPRSQTRRRASTSSWWSSRARPLADLARLRRHARYGAQPDERRLPSAPRGRTDDRRRAWSRRRKGCFGRWMKARGRLGGQNKVPRVIADPGLLASLLDAAGAPPISGEQ